MASDRSNVHRWTRRAGAGTPANRYHPFNPRGLYGQSYQREHFVRLIVENEMPFDRMKVLDLGCGDGTWCRYIAELKGTTEGVTGVDLSPERLALARKLSPIHYVEGDITKLPDLLQGSQFDLITAFVSLMFLHDSSELPGVFSSVRDLLRPGGSFYVYERDEEHDPTADSSGWPLDLLVSEARSAGFEVAARQRLFKTLLWRLDPLESMTFGRMDFWRATERFLPGRWGFYALLLRKARDP